MSAVSGCSLLGRHVLWEFKQLFGGLPVMHQVVVTDNIKECGKCHKFFELTFFSKRGNGKPNSYCKNCSAEYCRAHYGTNHKKHNTRRQVKHRVDRETMKAIVLNRKSVPCMDCKVPYPAPLMDFDHRNRADKLYTISMIASFPSLDTFLAEIEKCDVVCSNCHRRRTHCNGV